MLRSRQLGHNPPLGGSGPGGCDPAPDAVGLGPQGGCGPDGPGRLSNRRFPAGRGGRAAPRPPPRPARGGPSPTGFAGACGGLAGQTAHPPLTPRRDCGRAGAVRRRRANPRHGRRRWRGPSPLGGAGSAGTGGFAAGNPRPGSGGQGGGGVPVPVTDWRLRRRCVTPLPREPRCPGAPPRQGAWGRPAPPDMADRPPEGGAVPGRAGTVPPAAAGSRWHGTGRDGRSRRLRAGLLGAGELLAPGSSWRVRGVPGALPWALSFRPLGACCLFLHFYFLFFLIVIVL